MEIYIKYGAVWYMTEGGEMMCPPFVQSKAEAERYFGEPCQMITEPKKSRGKYLRKTEKRSVAVYSKAGVLIAVYKGIREASLHTGCTEDQIWKCCRGVIRSTCGRVFRYTIGEPEKKIAKYVRLLNK